MVIEVHCYTCQKSWLQPVKAELPFDDVVAMDFCGTCKRSQYREFTRQFEQKRLPAKVRVEEK